MSWKLRVEGTATPYPPEESVADLARLATRIGIGVVGDVNGVEAFANPSEAPIDVVRRWQWLRDSQREPVLHGPPAARSRCLCYRRRAKGARAACVCPCHK